MPIYFVVLKLATKIAIVDLSQYQYNLGVIFPAIFFKVVTKFHEVLKCSKPLRYSSRKLPSNQTEISTSLHLLFSP